MRATTCLYLGEKQSQQKPLHLSPGQNFDARHGVRVLPKTFPVTNFNNRSFFVDNSKKLDRFRF